MILEYLVHDKQTLRACSLTAHDFRHVALSFLGPHIKVNNANLLKQCAWLIRGGAFQYVRSLDLGIDNKNAILEKYWEDYFFILESFAQFRTLTRLWLSQAPFTLFKLNQREKLREAIVALGSTVTELGLYGCHFSSYEELISLVRSFPRCNFLFIRDCVTGKRATGGNAFEGLPEHRLTIKDLQLSAPKRLMLDISDLIEDAALDVGSLTSLVCDVGASAMTKHVAAAVAVSPMEHFQIAFHYPEGFQGESRLRNLESR